MARQLKPAKPVDLAMINAALAELRSAARKLAKAGASKAATRARAAINSADGARRHAQRRVDNSSESAPKGLHVDYSTESAPKGLHVDYSFDAYDLPRECVDDCGGGSGDVGDIVSYWREKLNFTVNREKAIACLAGYGAWDDDELSALTNNEIAEKVLWVAAGNFHAFLRWQEDNPCAPMSACYSGSDVFVLE